MATSSQTKNTSSGTAVPKDGIKVLIPIDSSQLSKEAIDCEFVLVFGCARGCYSCYNGVNIVAIIIITREDRIIADVCLTSFMVIIILPHLSRSPSSS